MIGDEHGRQPLIRESISAPGLSVCMVLLQQPLGSENSRQIYTKARLVKYFYSRHSITRYLQPDILYQVLNSEASIKVLDSTLVNRFELTSKPHCLSSEIQIILLLLSSTLGTYLEPMSNMKPLVLICSTPIYGHLMPLHSIAKGKSPAVIFNFAPK